MKPESPNRNSILQDGESSIHERADEIKIALELGFTALETAQLLDIDISQIETAKEQQTAITDDVKDDTSAVVKSQSETPEPKPSRGPRRGHFAKHIKHQLAAQGKLNAEKPMPAEQKKARRKKRKKR